MALDLSALTSPSHCIHGVEFRELTTYPDDRGFFRELIRFNDPFFLDPPAAAGSTGFGQWSHSKMGENTIKAWHFHHRQTDWWYSGVGVINTVLYDLREESPTFKRKMEFKLGDRTVDGESLEAIVRIPPGVAHGLRVVSAPVHLFYITTHTYDPKDEGRYPFNSPEIPHSWGDITNVVTSERDKKLYIPEYPRVLCR